MKLLIVIFIFLLPIVKEKELCNSVCTIYKWNVVTKNRIDRNSIKASKPNFPKLKINHDSLLIYLAKLTPCKDTLYNIRMYCKLKCEGNAELFIDKTGIIEYKGKCFAKDEKFIRFMLNKIDAKDIEDYWPLWLSK